MIELARLYAQIALLRRGPQDVPAAGFVLAMTLVAYFAVNAILSHAFQKPETPWVRPLLLDTVFMLAWYAVLLRIARHPERYVQTTSAAFGVETLFSPLLLAADAVLQRLPKESTWRLPLFFLWLIILVWFVAANSHILRNATEWPMPACVGVVLLYIAASIAILYFFFLQR
jgi:hypothetical protein